MRSNFSNLMVGIFLGGSILPFATLAMAQPKPSSQFGPGMSTKYTVTSSENTINVEVNPLNSVTPGDGALNVSRSGMVYVN